MVWARFSVVAEKSVTDYDDVMNFHENFRTLKAHPWERVFNVEQIVYWIGDTKHEQCTIALSNGQLLKIAIMDDTLAILTGVSPHDLDERWKKP